MPKIKVYSTPTCPYCIQLKEFLKENKVDFQDIDVALDEKAAEEMIDISGQMGVPVMVVDDNGKKEVIIGFDKDKIKQLLKQ